MKIRVAIADDHPLVINGLIQILQCCDDMEVVSTYANGQELIDGLASLGADVLLLDIHMPYRTGDEVAPIVLDQCNGIRIIALTNQDDTSYVKNMMQCGASGYILKTSGADIIVEAIRSVYRGETYIEASLKERVLQETLHAKRPNPRMPQLTRR